MLQNYNFYRLLSVFLNEPTRKFGWKELSKKLRLGPPSTKKYLDQIRKEGIITAENFGARTLYRANRESRKFRFFMTFDIVMKIESCGLIESLNKAYGYPTVILFGSYSTGEAVEGSDIDIAVITESTKKFDLADYERHLKNEIQLFRFSKSEIKGMEKKNSSLFNGIINGYVISGRIGIE